MATAKRLEFHWLRGGLGWYGETMPANVFPHHKWEKAGKRRVYEYCLNLRDPDSLVIELVYVPGGMLECDNCAGSSAFQSFDPAHCDRCGGTGYIRVPSFYVSRFPIMRTQWRKFIQGGAEASPENDARQDRFGKPLADPFNPVTMVYYRDVSAFCEWAHVTSMSRNQWKWLVPVTKRFPWGDEMPTPTHCVMRVTDSRRRTMPSVLPCGNCDVPGLIPAGKTADDCVVCDGDGGIAVRLLGASPQGALDLIGNIDHWLAEPGCSTVAGIAATGPHMWNPRHSIHCSTRPSDYANNFLGFRVTLPAVGT